MAYKAIPKSENSNMGPTQNTLSTLALKVAELKPISISKVGR